MHHSITCDHNRALFEQLYQCVTYEINQGMDYTGITCEDYQGMNCTDVSRYYLKGQPGNGEYRYFKVSLAKSIRARIVHLFQGTTCEAE